MSRKHNRYQYNNNYGSPYFYALLILVLIVLQWYRVGAPHGAEGSSSEANLVSNGGLFIIALFFLAACSCGFNSNTFPLQKHSHHKYRCH